MEAQDNMENISVFLFFGLTTSSRAVSPQEHYNPELVHYHCATARTGMHLIDKAFFLERQRMSGPAGSLLHILSTYQSQTWEKRDTHTLL